MTPEQWNTPLTVGPAADLYALGIMAFEALIGRVPSVADSLDEYYQLHRYS